jgi:ABC-type transporter Mla MlaB component
MLRITPLPGDVPGTTLKLEGKLIGAWVDELRAATSSPGEQGQQLRLDLAGVTYVDAAGTEYLRNLIRHGARIDRCSGFVAELIEMPSQEVT